ncbi:hypothetical protein GOODEAATRI_007567 [Goodea atripinnis]|uniref:SKICH domain-containing protein n=1 Tax=Goodea atripinnis TaxID=208336 RepID=A0ABV0MZG3_9TELE
METLPEAAATTDPPARTFSQVVFINIPHSYPPSSPINCRFTLNAAFQPHPRDWVGIFKNCNKVRILHPTLCSVLLPPEYYLPKDEAEFYQFCYIDNTGQVRGASTPFCFKNPSEQNTESIEDDDLLVITTQCQTLSKELQDAQAKLAAEREAMRTIKRQAEYSESELQDVKEQLKNLAKTCEMEQRTNSKYEMQLREMNEILADKEIFIRDKEQEIMLIKHEKNDVTQENLPDNIVAGVDAPASRDQEDRPGQPENIYETIVQLRWISHLFYFATFG